MVGCPALGRGLIYWHLTRSWRLTARLYLVPRQRSV